MKLLLDTHTLLWYSLNEVQLSPAARDAILDLSNEVLVSPASFWELAIKVSLGKLALDRPFEDFIGLCLVTYGFTLLPVEPRHAARLSALPYPPSHKDPFDRMLVAQALVEAATLVSADAALDQYGIDRIW